MTSMSNKKLENIIKEIGKHIENVNELSSKKIKNIACELPEYKEYLKNEFPLCEPNGLDELMELENIFVLEEVQELFMDDEFIIELKDGSKWLFSEKYQCILHPNLFNISDDEGRNIFKSLNDDVFICDDCGTRLIEREEILRDYEFYDLASDFLFPVRWSDQKIREWCGNIDEKNKEIQEKRRYRNEMKRMENQMLAEKEMEDGFCSELCENFEGKESNCEWWDNDNYKCTYLEFNDKEVE